jgi:hypothetical protein
MFHVFFPLWCAARIRRARSAPLTMLTWRDTRATKTFLSIECGQPLTAGRGRLAQRIEAQVGNLLPRAVGFPRHQHDRLEVVDVRRLGLAAQQAQQALADVAAIFEYCVIDGCQRRVGER